MNRMTEKPNLGTNIKNKPTTIGGGIVLDIWIYPIHLDLILDSLIRMNLK